ncbi:MAG: single-stranded-DNA-specific exonuclease RecJ [Bacillota bacterium]
MAGSVLLHRNSGDVTKAISHFLDEGTALGDVQSWLPEAGESARRILAARDHGETVAIYGDFDADGVTGAVVLTEAFRALGIQCVVYLPDRATEGYGFHPQRVHTLVSEGASLLVTVDCGISGHQGCQMACDLGVDVIITDHHLPPQELPRTLAILNPHLPSWASLELQYLSGAGVAYLLALAVLEMAGQGDIMPLRWARDLLTLSIAGDGQPLVGLNRQWVRSGLEVLKEAQRPGIRALATVAGIIGKGADRRPWLFDRDVTFGLVPRINAAGRMDSAHLAYSVLVEDDFDRCMDLARKLDDLNQRRKAAEQEILVQCQELADPQAYALCGFGPKWHPGVVGIVCSRLRESYQRPVALAGGEGEILKGSVRGIAQFDAYRALSQCREYLVSFGGHREAAGFLVKRSQVEEFFRGFSVACQEMLERVDMIPSLDVDSVVDLAQVSSDSIGSLMALGPFGQDNLLPVLASTDCQIHQVRLIGDTLRHLALTLKKGGEKRRFIWFGRGHMARSIALWGAADVAFTPYGSVYLGRQEYSPLVRDMRPARSLSGEAYRDLIKSLPKRRLIAYTWSEGAARALVSSAQKEGRAAALHTETCTGALAHEARLALAKPCGIVVSTSPWTLCQYPGPEVALFLLHQPLSASDASRLFAMSKEIDCLWLYSDWAEDSCLWLDWGYPSKELLQNLWNYLLSAFPGRRVPLRELGARWEEILSDIRVPSWGTRYAGAWEGAQALINSCLTILEDLGLAVYDQSRKQPELLLTNATGQISLSGSQLFARGKSMRSAWQESCERVMGYDFSLWRVSR